jgi:Na+/H+-dicarboxylate symporter
MDHRRTLLSFFEAVRDTMLVLVRSIVALAPLGVFALVLGLASRIGLPLAGAVTYFLGVLAFIILLHLALLYLVASFGRRLSLLRFAKALFPAQMVAISSRSSLACLPALIEGAQDVLRIPASTSGLVLPLAVSTFKLNVPVSWMAGAAFLARLYGIEFDLANIAALAAMSVLLSFGSPGIPGGAIVLKIPVLLSFGFPADGVALLVGADLLPDVMATLLNVTADLTAAVIVSRGAREQIPSSEIQQLASTPRAV